MSVITLMPHILDYLGPRQGIYLIWCEVKRSFCGKKFFTNKIYGVLYGRMPEEFLIVFIIFFGFAK